MFWKGAVSVELLANRPKIYGNCAFPQTFHTRKLGEFIVFMQCMPEYGFYLTSIIPYKNIILSSCEKILVRKNPGFGVIYAVGMTNTYFIDKRITFFIFDAYLLNL